MGSAHNDLCSSMSISIVARCSLQSSSGHPRLLLQPSQFLPLAVFPPDQEPGRENGGDGDDQVTQADDIRDPVGWAVDGAVDVRADNAAKLSHSISEPNANAGGDGAFERSDPFRPDDRIGRSGAGHGHNQSEVLDHRAVDGDEDDVADDGRALD